jgi:membrane associated rhomboid family serine protease
MCATRKRPRVHAPWLTLALIVAMGVVAALTLAPHSPVVADELAWGWGDDLWPGLVLWWLAHAGWWHVGANLLILVLVAPALERYVGAWRVVVAIACGNTLALLAHVGLNFTTVPLLGASGTVYALLAYSLVVGWHCPFEVPGTRHPMIWPAPVFYAVVVIEVLRWAAQVAGGRPPGSAAAHLGGIAAGVLVCGLLHRRWPGGPSSRRARGRGARDPAPRDGQPTRTG